MSQRRIGSILIIALSVGTAAGVSVGMDAVLVAGSGDSAIITVVGAVLFNLTVLLQTSMGGVIEWRRPGHTIGRLLMLSGVLYAFLAASWLTASTVQPLMDPGAYTVVNWAGSVLSWPGVALITGWIPLLFPTGRLPGPRWRLPAALFVVIPAASLVALAVRPGPLNDGTGLGSPVPWSGWPPGLQVLVDLIPLELLGLMVLAATSLVVRYRRGERVERAQIRWFGAALALTLAGFTGVVVQAAWRTDNGPLAFALVAYAGILAMPVAIAVAITRYRLYAIDRIISRTIGWTMVTVILGAVFAAGVIALQALLAGATQGATLAVAASTLVAFALFQPVRRRVQRAVDRRFDRARYDGERLAAAFGERLRDRVDLDGLDGEIQAAVGTALRPAHAALWIRTVAE